MLIQLPQAGTRVCYWRNIHDNESTELGTIIEVDEKSKLVTIELDCSGTVRTQMINVDILATQNQ